MCDDPARLAELEAALKEVDDHIKTMFKAEVRAWVAAVFDCGVQP